MSALPITFLTVPLIVTTETSKDGKNQNKKIRVYTKMVGLKVKSCITTTNLENATFLSITEHQTMSEPKILMVLNLFCWKVLCIYLCLCISVSKSCHQYIFWFACIQPGVVLKFWASLFLQNVLLQKKIVYILYYLSWVNKANILSFTFRSKMLFSKRCDKWRKKFILM